MKQLKDITRSAFLLKTCVLVQLKQLNTLLILNGHWIIIFAVPFQNTPHAFTANKV